MADTTIQQSGASGATPIKVVDQGDGTYALKVSGLVVAAGNHLLTEASDTITTEASDRLITET